MRKIVFLDAAVPGIGQILTGGQATVENGDVLIQRAANGVAEEFARFAQA